MTLITIQYYNYGHIPSIYQEHEHIKICINEIKTISLEYLIRECSSNSLFRDDDGNFDF